MDRSPEVGACTVSGTLRLINVTAAIHYTPPT